MSTHFIKDMLWVAVATMLLTACAADDDRRPAVDDEAMPIGFAGTVSTSAAASSRAANQINDDATLRAKGFGVFACYTGTHGYSDSNVRPDFMYNEHISYDIDHWTYSPLKYWPNGEGEAMGHAGAVPHYVSFMAYAPYSNANSSNADSNPEGYCISAFSLQQEIGNPWLTYRLHTDVTKQVDLLFAEPLTDRQKPVTDDVLSFTFAHALACVGDRVNIQCSQKMKDMLYAQASGTTTRVELLLKDVTITYTLTEKGRMVLWNGGEPNWQTILSENSTCTRTVSLLTDPVVAYSRTNGSAASVTEWDDPGHHGVYYIPIEVEGHAQKARVSVTYTVRYYTGGAYTEDAEVTGAATLVLSNFPDAYQPGKHLYINVTIEQETLKLTAAISPWRVVTEDVEAEDEEL